MNILAIGAHPDDIEIGCAGTLFYLKEKYNASLHVLLLTKSPPRNEEQHKALKLLDVTTFYCADMVDAALELKPCIERIETSVEMVNPDYIFTHYKDDTHQDHRILAEATLSACRSRGNILFYESFSTENFVPTLLVDIEGTLERKLKVVRAHTSQEVRLNLSDYVRILAKHRSHRTDCAYAEGFMTRKFVWR